MNDALKKLSDETKVKLLESIASKQFIDLVASTKSADDKDSGSFNVVVSTSDVDRQGESVDQKGWDLSFYKMNPVVLWAHDYSQLPIGVCTSIEVKDGKLVAEGKFAPGDANPVAQQIRKLYDLGFVNTTSVGFIPREYDNQKSGVISKSELLEFSFVPVPANPLALRLDQVKELGLDTVMLRTKGIVINETMGEKGAVEDRLEEVSKMKYAMYRPVWDLMDAVACVYFNESTPSEDLPKILSEAADIMKKIGSAEMTDEEMEKSIKKILGDTAPIEIKESITAILRNYVALGSFKLPEGDKGGKEIKAAEQRSKPSEALKEVNNFVETRGLLRMIDNAVGKALENFNRAAQKN